jgi:hypothetical protein
MDRNLGKGKGELQPARKRAAVFRYLAEAL